MCRIEKTGCVALPAFAVEPHARYPALQHQQAVQEVWTIPKGVSVVPLRMALRRVSTCGRRKTIGFVRYSLSPRVNRV